MFAVASLGYSSTAARLRGLLPKKRTASAPVLRPRIGLLAVGYGGFDQAADQRASDVAVRCVAEQPFLVA